MTLANMSGLSPQFMFANADIGTLGQLPSWIESLANLTRSDPTKYSKGLLAAILAGYALYVGVPASVSIIEALINQVTSPSNYDQSMKEIYGDNYENYDSVYRSPSYSYRSPSGNSESGSSSGARSTYGVQPVPRSLPSNPDDLLDRGYKVDDRHKYPKGTRYVNPETGDVLDFHPGTEGGYGWDGKDHYHRINPNSKKSKEKYLDKDGKPVGGSDDDHHLEPGTEVKP